MMPMLTQTVCIVLLTVPIQYLWCLNKLHTAEHLNSVCVINDCVYYVSKLVIYFYQTFILILNSSDKLFVSIQTWLLSDIFAVSITACTVSVFICAVLHHYLCCMHKYQTNTYILYLFLLIFSLSTLSHTVSLILLLCINNYHCS